MRDELVGVVLAAGAGTRLRPLTDERPKAMCPVGGVPLVDRALARVHPHVAAVAVNAHGSQAMLIEHLEGRAHVSVEEGARLGTAGALGRLRPWIDGRHVLVHNADSFVDDDLAALVEGWEGVRPRLLVRTEPHDSDFGRRRFLGVSLVPAAVAALLPDEPCGLYRLLWQPAHVRGELEVVEATGTALDCGTPRGLPARQPARVRGRERRGRRCRRRRLDHPLRGVAGGPGGGRRGARRGDPYAAGDGGRDAPDVDPGAAPHVARCEHGAVGWRSTPVRGSAVPMGGGPNE